MAAPQFVLQGSRTTTREVFSKIAPVAAWEIIGYIGLAFAVVGAIDIALAWFPPLLGSPEWEFGTITATLNTLPLPALGLLLFLASALATGNRLKVRIAAVSMVLASIVLLALAGLYLTVVPLALKGVDNAVVFTGLVKAVIKAGSLLILFPALLLWSAVRGWKAHREL